MPAPSPAAALARGLLRLLLADRGCLPEGELLASCGAGAPRARLRARLVELVAAGALTRTPRGRGFRVALVPGREEALRGFIRAHLSPRARLPGTLVLALLARLEDASPEGPAPPPGPALDPTSVLRAVEALTRNDDLGGMVKIHDLARRLGIGEPARLEAPLRQLASQRRVQLDPLSDPRVVPPEERSQGIPDPFRGMLFYVSLIPAR